jgi:hypothetical protein
MIRSVIRNQKTFAFLYLDHYLLRRPCTKTNCTYLTINWVIYVCLSVCVCLCVCLAIRFHISQRIFSKFGVNILHCMGYCKRLYFCGPQFSWIHEKRQFVGDLILWITLHSKYKFSILNMHFVYRLCVFSLRLCVRSSSKLIVTCSTRCDFHSI